MDLQTNKWTLLANADNTEVRHSALVCLLRLNVKLFSLLLHVASYSPMDSISQDTQQWISDIWRPVIQIFTLMTFGSLNLTRTSETLFA